MKRFIGIILTAIMVLSMALPTALAEDMRKFYNPEGYDTMYVTDIFTNTDIEPDEKGDFPTEGVEPVLIVQCCFGDFDFSGGEWDVEFLGFDENETFSLGLAEGCQVLMPPDFDELPENAVCEDLQAWADRAREELMDGEAAYPFYAHFDMNEEGFLTRLEYVYVPFN